MESSHIYVSDSDRQYILAKDDIIKISKLYGSRFIIITSKTAPAITLEYKDAKAAEAAYEDLMLQLCNLHTQGDRTMKTVFAYEVVLYDTDQDNRGHFFITSGLSFADNFGEAAAILESTYGEMLKSIKNLEFIHDDQNVITLPRDIIRDYIDGGKFVNEIPCDSEGRELATLNQNASKANDNW